MCLSQTCPSLNRADQGTGEGEGEGEGKGEGKGEGRGLGSLGRVVVCLLAAAI